MQKQVLKALPPIQNMDDTLLKQLIFSDNGKIPAQLSQLIPKNGEHILIILNTSKNTEMDTYFRINKEINKLIKNINFDSNVSVKAGGQPIILGEIKDKVMSTMALMLSLAVILMIIVLFLVFPVRRRLMSLAFVLIGLTWTFGFMGWAGIPITLATMATLPIIIGLGTDFGVQFHNRYEEEFRNSNNGDLAVKNSIKHIGPAVGKAVFIMALSFLTMFLSKAPMMQQFGLTLSIGVVFCYVTELVLMFSTFYLLDKRGLKIKIKENEDTWLSHFLSKYTGLVGKMSIPILIGTVILSGLGFSVEKSIPIETNLLKLIPQDLQSVKNTNYLQDEVGSTTYITYLVRADDVTDPATMQWMDSIGNRIVDKYKDIDGVTSLPSVVLQMAGESYLPSEKGKMDDSIKQVPSSLTRNIVSKDKHYATIQFKVNKTLASDKQLNLMNKITKDIGTKHGIQVNPAGAQVMMLYGIDNIASNHTLMILSGLAIIFIGLLLIYRRMKHAFYPLVPIILVLGFSPGTLKLLDITYNPLTTALSALILGIGTEFTILIMERFREEEAKGLDAKEAIKVSLSKVGQAITASGLTVIIGFSTLIFVSFPVLRTFGITTVIDTLYSLICALTILPALIILFRKKKKSN